MSENIFVWWTEDELDPPQLDLFNALLWAHHASVFRNNPSTIAVGMSAHAAGELSKSVAAGLMMLGGPHAPLDATWQFLANEDPAHEALEILDRGEKVPGWGSSFHKGEPDPHWIGVTNALRNCRPDLATLLARVTDALHSRGVVVYPNPSSFTVACGMALGIPRASVAYLLLLGRLAGWSTIHNQAPH